MENARRKSRIKYSGEYKRQSFDDIEIVAGEPQEGLFALDEARHVWHTNPTWKRGCQ